MDWKAIEKLVDMETEKKTRDISLASSNPYQNSGGYYSQNLYSRPTLSASPPPFSSMDRQGDRYVSTTNNSMQDISFAGPQSPSHRITTNDLNSSRSYMPGPNPSSSIHGQLIARDEISEMRQMLFQYSHRLQEVEDTLQRTVEGQQTLQRQRIELQDKCSLYEQEMKTLKSSHFQLHKEKEELLINNHKLQSTIDHIQQNVQKNVDSYATKDTMIKFIDSTMEQMKILNQNLHLTTSKNQEIQLTLDNFILSLLDMGSVTSNTPGTTANGPPSMMSDASGKGNTGTSTSALMNTYQLLKSNTGFSEQIKSLIQSSLSQNIHTLFQSSIKGFQDNLQSYINMQLKDFKEKQLQTVQTFLDSRVNTYYQNELNIVKADMMQFKHTFDEYQKISQLLASQLQPGRMSSVGGLGASGGSGIGGFGLGAGSGGMSKEQEELTSQVKDKLTNIEKTITELQNQQKQYHMILTNQNDIITNNTNLQESSRIYYDNYFKQLMKDFNELDKKVDTSLKTYQNMKDELLSDNWTNQNKIIKDLSDRNLLISSQINQMKTELQDTVNYITSQIINNNNNLREEFSLLLKNKDLKLEDIQQRLTIISELTIQLNETDLINKKNSKEIEEIVLMMKSSEYQQKVQHEQHQQKIFNVTETINNIEKQLKDELQLQQLKQKEKNTSFDAMFTSIQDLQHIKWNEIITHQNTLLQEMNDKYSQFNELNNKTREQSLQNNEKLVTLMSKIEILDISFKKDLELLKLDVLDQITSKTDDFFTFNSSLEKKFEEIKEELSLIQNKTLLYQENHTEMMKTYHNEFNKYDKELNKYQLQLNNLQELLNHRYDKLQYNLDEQLKFTNISLSQLDKDITNKLTQLQQSNDANIVNIQKDIETSNQTTENKLQLLSMQTQSDSQKMKESILKVLQDLFNEQFQLMNQKLSNQDKESNNNFNTMAEKLLEFSTALNFLEDEDHRLNETMTKNKELLQSELYTWKNKIWNELEGLQKNTKESHLETKYELSQLFNKLQILESRPSGNANPVNSANAIGGSGIGAMTMGNLLGGLGDDDGGGDQSFSYQHSFLYDPNDPYQGVQANQPPEDRGVISSEQMMKLSSVVELSSTRIGQVETDIFNLQTEVKSLQNLKDQCKLLQDQMSNIGKMQAGFMELTKGLALQSSSNSNTPVDGVTIEMLLKAKNELKSEYNEQNRQLSVNLFEQEARVKEELKKLQEDVHKTIEIVQKGQKQEGGHNSEEIEKILLDWKSEHQSSYNQIAQRVQLLDQQVQEKDNQSTKQIGSVREELQQVFQQQLRSVENTVESQKLQLHLIDENLAKLTVSAEEWKQLEKEIADITQNAIPASKIEISQSRTELELLQKEVKRLAEAQVAVLSSIRATGLSSSEIAETKKELQVLQKEVERLAEAQVAAQSSILASGSTEIAGTKEEVHLLQKELKRLADAHILAQSSIPATASLEIAETKEKLQVLQNEVKKLVEAHSENSTQLQNQRIDEDSTVQLLQTEIQALKEIYEKFKDAQTIQQEQMVNWKDSLTEQFEERIQLLTQQEENNNNHQIHLMAALEEELKKMKELILVSQPSVPPPPPTKTPPLSPAKMASPMSAEVIENTVFTKLSQVMKNEISNLSNERNKQNEINLLTMHTKLQHSIEEKLQSLSSTLNETNKRSEVDRESFQQFQKEFNDAQLKEKLLQLREEWAKFLVDSKSKDENIEERIGDVEFSQKQLTERLQSSVDSLQNKSNSLQEQMQVLQEEILSLSDSKDDIPKLVSAAFVDQKDALLKSFLEEIKKFKPPTPAPPANTTPQASPKVPVNTDNSMKLAVASPSVTPNTSNSVKPAAEGVSKAPIESKEVPIIVAPSKQRADSPKTPSTVTVEEKTALKEPKSGLEKVTSNNTAPVLSTNKEIKEAPKTSGPTAPPATPVGTNIEKKEEKPISERSVEEIANSMSVSPASSPAKESGMNKSGNFEEGLINRSNSSDSMSSGAGKPPLASPLTKKTSFSSSISKLNEKLGTTKPVSQIELKTTSSASVSASPVKSSPADSKQVVQSSPIKSSDDKGLPSSLNTSLASSVDVGKTVSTPERTVFSNDGSKLMPSEGTVISSSLTKIMTSPRSSTENSAIVPNSAKSEAKALVSPPSTPKKTDTPSATVQAETAGKAPQTNASLSSPKLIPTIVASPALKQESKEDKAESAKAASTLSTPSREKTSSATSTPGENRRSSSILDKIAAFETKNITKDPAPASRATSSGEKVELAGNKPPEVITLSKPGESDKTSKSEAKIGDIKPNTSFVSNQTPLKKKPELDDSFDAEDDQNELSPASKASSKLDASTSFLSPISSDTSPIKHSERKAVVPSVGRQRFQNDGDDEESNEIHLNFDQSSSHYLSEVSQTPPRKTVSSNQDSHEDRQDHEKRRHHLLSSLADDEEFVSSSEESSVMGKDDEHDDDEEDDDSFGSPRASSTIQGPPQSLVAGVSFPMVTTPDRGPIHRVNPISSTVPAPSPLNATVSNPLPPSTSAGSVNTAPLPSTTAPSSNAPASTASSNVVLSGSLLGRSKK